MKNYRIALIGSGGRGIGMARLAAQSPWSAEIVALADPAVVARQRGEEALGIGRERQFADHRDLLARCPELDAAIVATEVHNHARVACDCLRAGVSVYLEKPMCRTIDEAHEVVATARSTGVPLMVGMNLRFAPFYRRLKELVADGAIGELISVEWKEVLSADAWADGYCRASWYSRRSEVGGWLLEKSCHDIDQINWLMDAPCARVASLGSRSHFVPREDVPERCTDGCPEADE
ncbi:MAG: Gfo/Idh/MocA family oxidoreductase, partial [Candidatus Brocadiia bacterium]|nr:Gfo/Idh/MocA family oxidoreductase [Candidatus Brocadiia bacterium]